MGKQQLYDELGLLRWSEIARRTGWSIETVQRDYTRAIAKLRDAMLAEGITPAEFAAYMRIRERSSPAPHLTAPHE